jgi:tetratricopeptide (TPR) repeat protein
MQSRHYDQGILYYDSKRWKLAAKAFADALAEQPEHADTHSMLALCHMHLKRLKQALDEARESTRLEPENAHAHSVLSMILLEQRNYPEAQRACEEAKSLQPLDASHQALDSSIALAQGQWRQALTKADAALQLDPCSEWAVRVRAMALLNLTNFAEAETAADYALQLDPQGARAHVVMGRVLLGRNKLLPAMAHFREALRIDPSEKWIQETLLSSMHPHREAYSWLYMLGDKEPPAQGQYRVAQFGRPIILSLCLAALVFSIITYLICRFPESATPLTAPLLTIEFLLIALAAASSAWGMCRSNVLWNDDEIIGPNVTFTRKHRLPWHDLAKIEHLFSPRVFRITSNNGDAIVVNERMHGFAALQEKIEEEQIRLDLKRASESQDPSYENELRLVQHDQFARKFTLFLLVVSIVWASTAPSGLSMGGLGASIVISWEMWISKVQWNDDIVSGRNLFGQTRSFHWKDLKSVKRHWSALVISANDGSAIWLYGTSRMEGFTDFAIKLSTEANRIGLKRIDSGI